MRNRSILTIFVFLALMIWAGLILFMNRKPPTALNQALFLFIWGLAIGCTAIPIAYGVETQFSRWPATTDQMSRAIRRGSFLGALAFVLMALHFLRLLTWLPATLLALLALTVEVSITLKSQ